MIPGPHAQRDRVRLLVWWVIWASLIVGLVVIYFLFGRVPLPAGGAGDKVLTGLIGLVPLFVSIIIRWLVLPRYNDLQRAFSMFIVGLALADACGLMGIFLGGPYRDDVFLLGVLGLAQFAPCYPEQLAAPTAGGGLKSAAAAQIDFPCGRKPVNNRRR
jgi:hypothetical protein